MVIPKSCCVHFTYTDTGKSMHMVLKIGETGDRKLYMKPDYHRINMNNSVMCQNLNGNNIYPGHGMVASCIQSVNHLYEMPHRTAYPNWSECHNWFLIEFPSDSCVWRMKWTWMIHADAYESHTSHIHSERHLVSKSKSQSNSQSWSQGKSESDKNCLLRKSKWSPFRLKGFHSKLNELRCITSCG